MKKEFIFKRLADVLKISVLFSLIIFIASCGDDDDPQPPPVADPGLVDVANNAGLTVLVDALTEAGIASTVTSADNLTIFAPTNQAFTDFLAAIGQSSLEDIPQDVLVDVLEYHVVQASAGPIASTDLAPDQDVNTLGGESLNITVSGGNVTLNPGSGFEASVSTPDVDYDNGIVHVIDEVLVPPSMQPIVGTIVAPAYFNNNFTTLIAAVNAAPASVLETLLGNGPSDNGLTLFAPTNAAFEAAGITDLGAVTDVAGVLTYHLIDGTFEAEDVLGLDPAQAATVNGQEVFFSVVGSDLFINGRTHFSRLFI